MATLDDVAHCYRQFLGREMDDLETAIGHLADGPDLWTLIRRFTNAPERQLAQAFSASRYIQATQDARNIEHAIDGAREQRLIDHIETVWRRYGRDDAYYSVLTHPAYRAGSITDANIDHFYTTGAAEIEEFGQLCRRNAVEPDPAWSVCELGCGVARVGTAFARNFSEYLGIDISTEHLAIARARLDAEGATHARLMLLPDFLQQDVAYDLFYSTIVLQHNPPPIMRLLLDAGLGRLRPGGYAYFQLPCHLSGYSFDTDSYLAGVGRKDEMEMHALPQREVFASLAKHGLTPVEVVPDGRIGPIGFSYAFFARKA
ncbi:class I SAM-dependent methyltransferase [Sphingomonas sp. KR3-1]|uniref:class I SAM-dependent methyltransferase n=1 Tax=Sphingomonas sp. KR3-1 TaxID=3156611 RepID=UPI0032B33338